MVMAPVFAAVVTLLTALEWDSCTTTAGGWSVRRARRSPGRVERPTESTGGLRSWTSPCSVSLFLVLRTACGEPF